MGVRRMIENWPVRRRLRGGASTFLQDLRHSDRIVIRNPLERTQGLCPVGPRRRWVVTMSPNTAPAQASPSTPERRSGHDRHRPPQAFRT
jgi:hypothetical protein